MNKYYLKGTNGKYFVLGAGFTADTKCKASQLSSTQLNVASQAGFCGTADSVPTVKSFAVNYVRKEDIASGTVKANGNNPSSRRFATFAEAAQHGKNWKSREASASHIGFYVTESCDAVNAKINWETGLTNSL